MKIKVAIFDWDEVYLHALEKHFRLHYGNQIELYVTSQLEILLGILQERHIDVVCLGERNVYAKNSMDGQLLLILAENNQTQEIEGVSSIGKYQKAENIFYGIWNFCKENTNGTENFGDEKQCVVFTSVAGGVGTSTCAAAYAINESKNGKKVLYLDLNETTNINQFFCGSGECDLSDVIYAVKKGRDLNLKLMAYVRHDESGVDFFAPAKYVLDMIEMTDQDAIQIFQVCARLDGYDVLVVDMKNYFRPYQIEIMKQSTKLRVVSDGSKSANEKVYQMLQALQIYERQENINLIGKTGLIYNGFSSKNGNVIDNLGVPMLAGIRKIVNAQERRIADAISQMQEIKEV